MILSHHGRLEFGSPKEPMFPEAQLLHHLDDMDSKMECLRSLIAHDRQLEGEWTGYSQPLDRSVLKKQRYLEGGQKPAVPAAPAPAPQPAPPPPPARRPTNTAFGEKLLGALGAPPPREER
jgi:3'-5' exoribonuclease